MRRTVGTAALLAMALAASVGGGEGLPDEVAAVGAVPVVTGLSFPAAFTLATDGRIFYGERLSGEIRIYDPANGSDSLFFTVPNVVGSANDERGLLGLALAPGYPERPFVYAYATRRVGGSDRNQLLRIRDVAGSGSEPRILWSSSLPANVFHNGGRILFGPDTRLYAINGDAGNPANAQSLGNDAGKIMRFTHTGAIPPDNPFPGSANWAYGIRNSFGFGFDPLSGFLWETENGPTCNDEVNRVEAGLNYGWGPSQTCSIPPPPPKNTNRDGPDPVQPQVWFTPTIAPTGLAFCVGCGIPSAEGALFFGSFNDSRIRRSTLDPSRSLIVSTTVVYTHTDFVLSLERGPDNAVYFSDTSGIWKLVEM